MYTWKLTAYGENFYNAGELKLSQKQLEIIFDWQIHRYDQEGTGEALRKTGMDWGTINDLVSNSFEHPDIISIDIT